MTQRINAKYHRIIDKTDISYRVYITYLHFILVYVNTKALFSFISIEYIYYIYYTSTNYK